ncbi:hypothetical protein [Selenomonas sp. F0473]|uniref:hypothetical protein n=1 Tax=Selenomonas sp. F0473 TaxID=999423 RepID=UPI0025E46CC5|nr:hypothetical protein [Selenomonas sp. F0473]
MNITEGTMQEKTRILQEVIMGQFQYLQKLDHKVRESVQRAEEARERAIVANHVVVGPFYNKERAIECLQEAVKDLAKAQQSAAEAQKLSFEYQQRLAEAVHQCFMMSVQDIAITRATINKLEELLKCEEKEGASDLLQTEVKKLISQLVAREDLLNRLENSEQKVKILENRIEQLEVHLANQ